MADLPATGPNQPQPNESLPQVVTPLGLVQEAAAGVLPGAAGPMAGGTASRGSVLPGSVVSRSVVSAGQPDVLPVRSGGNVGADAVAPLDALTQAIQTTSSSMPVG